MIVVTGAAGFIGSHFVRHWQKKNSVLAIDHAPLFDERDYLTGVNCEKIDADLPKVKEALQSQAKDIQAVIHMGAITDTGFRDQSELSRWNTKYSEALWDFCASHGVPLVYASSAATYGDGRLGFSDDPAVIKNLKPLNPYGQSKQDFDLFALQRKPSPPLWYGLKFFNVYGPHEDHKSRMASAIWHGYREVKTTGEMTLFRSHNPLFRDGEQARDFVFVSDILDVTDFLLDAHPLSGILNLGSGVATTFLDLATTLFEALGKEAKINWVETPEKYRAAYQYRTEARLARLRDLGYSQPMTPLQVGISKYVAYLERKSL